MLATQEQPREVTQLLLAWNDGDESALEKLVPLVYNELRRLAQRRMRLERPDHTLQTTALINEAYLRLVDVHNAHGQNRAHFFGSLCAVDAANPRRLCAHAPCQAWRWRAAHFFRSIAAGRSGAFTGFGRSGRSSPRFGRSRCPKSSGRRVVLFRRIDG